MVELPLKYTESMKALLKDEYDKYIESFNGKRLYGLRVNNLKIATEEFKAKSPFELKPVDWIENGFYYDEELKPAKHPYYYAGLYYIQEPSAMTPANVLPIEQGDCVLDMCAAPGGKSTELAVKLNGTGLLVSNDISSSRSKALLKNIEVFGAGNICVLNEDPVDMTDRFSGFFDKVLIDAPCSGEGMFRKDNKLIKAWEKNGPEFYSKIQKNIILAGADMLKPGGMMVYSTCTFSVEEDEDTIAHLLYNRTDMHLVDIKPYSGFSHGYDNGEGMQLDRAVRIFPHKMQGEGHFVALIKKDGDGYAASKKNPVRTAIPDELKEFLDRTGYEYNAGYIEIRDNRAYLISPYMPDTKGLRVVRNGLLLGELKKNRFEPSQAFAMALKAGQFDNWLSLSVTDERVVRYLKGETLDVSDSDLDDGWALVCVDGFTLGWGKVSGGQLKNKYLAGWRWV